MDVAQPTLRGLKSDGAVGFAAGRLPPVGSDVGGCPRAGRGSRSGAAEGGGDRRGRVTAPALPLVPTFSIAEDPELLAIGAELEVRLAAYRAAAQASEGKGDGGRAVARTTADNVVVAGYGAGRHPVSYKKEVDFRATVGRRSCQAAERGGIAPATTPCTV